MSDETDLDHAERCAQIFGVACSKLVQHGVSEKAVIHALTELAVNSHLQLCGGSETAEWLRRIADRIEA